MRIAYSATSREFAGDPIGVKPRNLEVCGSILNAGDVNECMFTGCNAALNRISC